MKIPADVDMHNIEFMGCRHAVEEGIIYQNSLESSAYLLRPVRIPTKLRDERPKNRGYVIIASFQILLQLIIDQ